MFRNFYSKFSSILTVRNGFNRLVFIFICLFFVLPHFGAVDKTKLSKTVKKKSSVTESKRSSSKNKAAEAARFKAGGRLAIRSRLMLEKPLKDFTDEERKTNRQNLEILRRQPETQRFFAVVQEGEAGNPKIMVGNRCPKLTEKLDLSRHPGEVLPSKCFYWYVNKKGKLVFSTASGNYQITRDNYRKIAPFLDIRDFRVLSQQLIALELMRRGSSKTKNGLLDLAQGKTRQAVCTGTQDWASSKCSTLEANRKKDYQKIYDRQERESAKTLTNRQRAVEKSAVKTRKSEKADRKSKSRSKK